MNRRGTTALEAVIASGLILMLLTAVVSQVLVFWQVWQQTTEFGRQRQWAAMTFEFLDKDMANSLQVVVDPSVLQITLPDGTAFYRVTAGDSLYRVVDGVYSPLALVDTAVWWREGNLVWVELVFPGNTYRCCYFAAEDEE